MKLDEIQDKSLTEMKTMNISIIGYVGMVTGLGFAELGHRINFVDVDAEKVDKVNSGKAPIYEKGNCW